MRKAKPVIGILISFIFLFLAFRNIKIEDLFSIIKQVDISLLILTILIILAGLSQRALRWGYFLNYVKRDKFRNLFSVLMVGYFGNNILPARMGEILRIYALHKNYRYSRSRTLATIVLEKVFDVFFLLFFLVIVIAVAPLPAWILDGGLFLGLLFIAISLFLVLFSYEKERALKVVDLLTFSLSGKRVQRIKEILERFDQGLQILKTKKALLIVMIFSCGIWMTEFLFLHVVLSSFNLHLGPAAPVLLSIVLNLGMLLPSSPGYVGTYHYMCIVALKPFNVEKELALSISIVLHLLAFAVTTIIGFFCFWRENLKLSEAEASAMGS